MPNDIYTVNEVHRLAEEGAAPAAHDLVGQWTRLNRNYRRARVAGVLTAAAIALASLLARDEQTCLLGAIVGLALMLLNYVISYLVWRCWVCDWLRHGDSYLHAVAMNASSTAAAS